jgi:hypothetical protein
LRRFAAKTTQRTKRRTGKRQWTRPHIRSLQRLIDDLSRDVSGGKASRHHARVARQARAQLKRVKACNRALSVASNNMRGKRWIGEAAGVMGLLNLFSTHQISTRLDHTDAALRATAVTVDGVNGRTVKNADNIDRLKEAMRNETGAVEQLANDVEVDGVWSAIETMTEAIVTTFMAVTSHTLSPFVAAIVDMDGAWNTLERRAAKHGFKLPAASWHGLLQQSVSFFMRENRVTIVVAVPMVTETKKARKMYEHVSRPILVRNTTITIRDAEDKKFIVAPEDDKPTGRTVELTEAELHACGVWGDTHYCAGDVVEYAHGAGGCLQALWYTNMDQMEARCDMRTAAAYDEVFPLGDNTFLVRATHDQNVFVTCEKTTRGPDAVLPLFNGIFKLRLQSGCTAATAKWTTASGKEAFVSEIHAELDEEDVGNFTFAKAFKWIDEGLLNITGPTRVQKVSDRVNKKLNEPTVSTLEIVVLSIVGLLVLLAVALFLYMMCRKKATNTALDTALATVATVTGISGMAQAAQNNMSQQTAQNTEANRRRPSVRFEERAVDAPAPTASAPPLETLRDESAILHRVARNAVEHEAAAGVGADLGRAVRNGIARRSVRNMTAEFEAGRLQRAQMAAAVAAEVAIAVRSEVENRARHRRALNRTSAVPVSPPRVGIEE